MLLDARDCSGQLCWQENVLNMDFDLSCAKDGEIKLKLKDIPFGKDVLWLHELFHRKDRYFEFLQLKGSDGKGNSITSNSVVLNSLRNRSDKSGSWICPEGTCMQLRLDSDKPVTYEAAEVLLHYRLLGFKCSGRLSGSADVGTVEVAGYTKIENYDEVTGVLTIKAQPGRDFNLTNWIERCDKSVRSILDILSLANDRYIDWTSRTIFHDKSWMSSLFTGPREAGRPSEPLFTYLNLQPALNLALTNYSEEIKQKTGLDVAIEWYLIKSTYAEVQFLTAMTALEHLVYIYAEQKERSTIFENEIFENIIRPQIEGALNRSLEILVEKEESADKRKVYKKQIKAAKRKITELNRYAFKENLMRFLKEYKIPLDGIDQDIELAVDARHQIVHRGLYMQVSDDQSIRDHLAVLRELLKRIFLTLLKYHGEYQSFLNGQEDKSFRL